MTFTTAALSSLPIEPAWKPAILIITTVGGLVVHAIACPTAGSAMAGRLLGAGGGEIVHRLAATAAEEH